MSFDAMRWAMAQPVTPAVTKFVLVAMAECVNDEAGTMECWPSYAYLARRTGANPKTVEASMYRLREQRYIVDTGKREGGTGKVPVYRLNDPNNGVVTPGPQGADANGTRPLNTPGIGGIDQSGNPPKNGVKSPQKVEVIPPKTEGNDPKNGVRNKEGKKKGTRKEPGAVPPEIPGVPMDLLTDWVKVRKDKRAGPITATVIEGLVREANKAGLTVADAVRYCCEAGWQGFNAGFYAKREGKPLRVDGHVARQETFV